MFSRGPEVEVKLGPQVSGTKRAFKTTRSLVSINSGEDMAMVSEVLSEQSSRQLFSHQVVSEWILGVTCKMGALDRPVLVPAIRLLTGVSYVFRLLSVGPCGHLQ